MTRNWLWPVLVLAAIGVLAGLASGGTAATRDAGS